MALRQINEFGLWLNKFGTITTDQYGTPLSDPTITPSPFTVIKMFVSALGGNLLYQSDDGIVYWFAMIAGKEYPVIIQNVANAQILASGTDWQGTDVTNSVTDLRWAGE